MTKCPSGCWLTMVVYTTIHITFLFQQRHNNLDTIVLSFISVFALVQIVNNCETGVGPYLIVVRTLVISISLELKI